MHVVVNAAMSADGKLSSRRREQIEISGATDFARVDRLRADSDAVMVGVGTVLADDPHLTLDDEALQADRAEAGLAANPTRVVADSSLRTPRDARVLDNAAVTILLVSDAVPPADRQGLPAHVSTITAGENRVDLRAAFEELEAQGIDQLMVEGGGELIFSLFESELVDELSVFVGSTIIGGRDAPTLADGDGFVDEFTSLSLESVERMDDGVLLEWDVR